MPAQYELALNNHLYLKDASDVSDLIDIWITDPPYADAVNYH